MKRLHEDAPIEPASAIESGVPQRETGGDGSEGESRLKLRAASSPRRLGRGRRAFGWIKNCHTQRERNYGPPAFQLPESGPPWLCPAPRTALWRSRAWRSQTRLAEGNEPWRPP